MRIAVLSDIHGVLPALEAVLAEPALRSADRIVLTGDLVDDGVCAVFLADKLGVSQPTLSEHMKVLTDAGLVTATRIKQWTFYKRDERRIDEVKRAIVAQI